VGSKGWLLRRGDSKRAEFRGTILIASDQCVAYRKAHVYACRIGHVDPRMGNGAHGDGCLQPPTGTALHFSAERDSQVKDRGQ
jgi:hypothetical protein